MIHTIFLLWLGGVVAGLPSVAWVALSSAGVSALLRLRILGFKMLAVLAWPITVVLLELDRNLQLEMTQAGGIRMTWSSAPPDDLYAAGGLTIDQVAQWQTGSGSRSKIVIQVGSQIWSVAGLRQLPTHVQLRTTGRGRRWNLPLPLQEKIDEYEVPVPEPEQA